MKRVLAGTLALAALAAATTVYAGRPAQTGVNGSLHDMREFVYGNGTNAYTGSVDSMDRVCVFCHTPHFATNAQALGDASLYPLWNHQLQATNYTPYTWATPLNAGDGAGNDFVIATGDQAVVGPSRLCLSCHDGLVAVDQHNGNGVVASGNAAYAGANFISARANLTNDLSDDHPIGFDYNGIYAYRQAHSLSGADAAGDREIAASTRTFATTVVPEQTTQGTYNTVNRQAAGGRTIGDVLYQGTYMTCATCHEVHNKDNVTQANFNNIQGENPALAPNFFLYAPEKDSAICLSCHIK